MNREAVLHNPVSNYAFPLSYEKFKVRLRAGKGRLGPSDFGHWK